MKIKGITVTLISKVECGRDAFNHPIYSEKEIEVKDVLVAPASIQEVTEMVNMTGKKAIYNMAIPKGDTHVWKDQKVRFFGEIWQVIGFPQEGNEENIPLDWNKKFMVAKYE